MSNKPTVILVAFTLLLTAGTAHAYIGPGAGISVLGSLLGILTTVLVAIGAILLWPLRTYMKRRKARREATAGAETRPDGDSRDR